MSNENKPNDDNEKTVIFNSASNSKPDSSNATNSAGNDQTKHKDNQSSGDDKTRIDNSGLHGGGASQTNSAQADSKDLGERPNGASQPESNGTKKQADQKSDSVSKKTFSAGMAGAAAAGVVAGTLLSDEIKGMFVADATDAPESPEDEIQDVTSMAEEVPMDDTSDAVAEAIDSNSETEVHIGDSLSIEVTNENGTFEVSMMDLDGDGEMDSINSQATLVDGNSIGFSEVGDTLNAYFNTESIQEAMPEDYIDLCCSGEMEGFGPECLGAESYPIQSGDTLSEIAAAHNTSIGDLLALNPQIEDANLIYAGDNLLIPVGDNDSNPYAGWSPSEPDQINWDGEYITDEMPEDGGFEGMNSDMDGAPFEGEEVDITTEDYMEVDGESEFQEMDWQSFEDQPLDEYSSALNEYDFDSMETPESYCDYSNDLDSMDFI
jgi:hypothetical protein